MMQPYCEQFNGIIYYLDPHEERYQIYVPESMRQQLLQLHHGGKLGGHFGYQKIILRMRDRYYWPKMCNDIVNHCRNCAVCAARSTHRLRAEPKLLSEFPPSQPWTCVNMDILNMGQVTQKGNCYIFVITDKLTHFCIQTVMPNREAETVLKQFVDAMLIMCFPRHIFTDRGTQFTSTLAAELARVFGMM